VARAWCFLVAIAVLFGVAHAGTRYFYCEALGLSVSDPCVHCVHRETPCPIDSLERTPFDCCEVITLPAMPDGARTVQSTVPAASVTALLPAVDESIRSPGVERRLVLLGRERWRAPPRGSGDLHAQLMVFLT
jgi:hypothetical protein